MVLLYIHVDGDFNPQRVTVARVHEGLHPQRVMVARVHEGIHPQRVHEEATLSIPPWPSPTKDLPHSRRSSRSRRSPCPYKLLGSSPHHIVGSKRHLTNLEDTTLQKDNKWCVDDELLALVLQMIVSPTLNSLS